MKTDMRLGAHVRSFFHDYLSVQRAVSPNTIQSYRDALRLFLAYAAELLDKPVLDLNVDELTSDVVLGFLDHLERARGNSASTRNARLAALHVFFRHVASRDPLCFAMCQRIVAIPAKRTAKPAVEYLERDELDAVLQHIDRHTPAGRRDYALISVMYQTGARVQEVLDLRAVDLHLDRPAQVRLWGKGRKERFVPLWPQTATVLRELLEERRVDPRCAEPVFVNARGRPLTRWGARYILNKHSKAAASAGSTISRKRVHPHILRHTSAVHMLQAGVDPNTIRDMLGHANAETTWRYARINMEMKRKAIEASAPAKGEAFDAPWVHPSL